MQRFVSRMSRHAALLILGTGCGTIASAPDSDPGSSGLHTDRATYVATRVNGQGNYAQYGFRIVARFDNTSPDTLYLARCYPDSPTPIYGVGLADGPAPPSSGRSAYNGAWACVGHDRQIAVAPRSSRIDTLPIRGPNMWDGINRTPIGVLTGRMRLGYEVQRCRGDALCPCLARRDSPIRSTSSRSESVPLRRSIVWVRVLHQSGEPWSLAG